MRAALLLPLLLLTGCGYVGPVQPPSPEIPTAVTNLSAVERGDKIIVTFTPPPRTTDGLAISHFSHIDLRIGPTNQPLEADPSVEVEPQSELTTYSTSADPYTGQHIIIAVRTAMRKNGHFSTWSNQAVLQVVAPLAQPVVQAQPSANGVVLHWPASNGAQFVIQRQTPSDKQPFELATVNDNQYTDISAQPDTDYRYTVTARKDLAESLPSDACAINFPDKYPPATPTGLTALAAPDAIDLAWQRNTEPDLQGYFIDRSVNGSEFQRIGSLVALPNYTDRAVEHGKTYAYRISAVDKKSNLSAASTAAEVQF